MVARDKAWPLFRPPHPLRSIRIGYVKLFNAREYTLSGRKLANLTCAAIDNYVRFANEYTQQVYGIVSQGQEFVSHQMEEGNRRFAQIADISTRAVEAVQSVKSTGDEAVNEADQQVSRVRQQRAK